MLSVSILALVVSLFAAVFAVWSWREAKKFTRQHELEAMTINALMDQLAYELHTKIPLDTPQRRVAVRQRVIKACHEMKRQRPADAEMAEVMPWLS